MKFIRGDCWTSSREYNRTQPLLCVSRILSLALWDIWPGMASRILKGGPLEGYSVLASISRKQGSSWFPPYPHAPQHRKQLKTLSVFAHDQKHAKPTVLQGSFGIFMKHHNHNPYYDKIKMFYCICSKLALRFYAYNWGSFRIEDLNEILHASLNTEHPSYNRSNLK